jgi:hypothetical protein
MNPQKKQLKTVVLQRLLSDEQGTLGKLLSFWTLELPWEDNATGQSCIPAGTYKVVWSLSPRLKKYTYEILGVPKRAGIRIHGGNYAGNEPDFISHSLGCPLLGMKTGTMKGQRAVMASQIAVQRFITAMNKETFLLEIRDA